MKATNTIANSGALHFIITLYVSFSSSFIYFIKKKPEYYLPF